MGAHHAVPWMDLHAVRGHRNPLRLHRWARSGSGGGLSTKPCPVAEGSREVSWARSSPRRSLRAASWLASRLDPVVVVFAWVLGVAVSAILGFLAPILLVPMFYACSRSGGPHPRPVQALAARAGVPVVGVFELKASSRRRDRMPLSWTRADPEDCRDGHPSCTIFRRTKSTRSSRTSSRISAIGTPHGALSPVHSSRWRSSRLPRRSTWFRTPHSASSGRETSRAFLSLSSSSASFPSHSVRSSCVGLANER